MPRPGPRQSALSRLSSQHRRQRRRIRRPRRSMTASSCAAFSASAAGGQPSVTSPAPIRSAPAPPAAPRRRARAAGDRTSAWPWSYLCPARLPMAARHAAAPATPATAARRPAPGRYRRHDQLAAPVRPLGPARARAWRGGRSPSGRPVTAAAPIGQRRPLSLHEPASGCRRDHTGPSAPLARRERRRSRRPSDQAGGQPGAEQRVDHQVRTAPRCQRAATPGGSPSSGCQLVHQADRASADSSPRASGGSRAGSPCRNTSTSQPRSSAAAR